MKTMIRAVLATFLLTALAAATPAFATSLDYFTVDFGGSVYTWSLPSTPTIVSPPGDDYFEVANVLISTNGGTPVSTTVAFSDVDMTFGGTGGFYLFGPFNLQLENPPQMFSGPLSDPTFTPGVYDVQNDSNTSQKGTVTISATPEPGTLALFGTGILFLAGALRRRLHA
jgi:hypothetical protein